MIPMIPIKHIIFIMMNFRSKEKLDTYLKISKKILLPSLYSQINKNFSLGLLINEKHKDYLNLIFEDFNPTFFKDKFEYFNYVKKEGIQIQTRHDMDDWCSFDYIEKIQDMYKQNINSFPSFIIQAQPIKYLLHEKKEIRMRSYSQNCTSMFISLCQKQINQSILDRKHTQMGKIVPKVFTLPEGYVKWIIHGDNRSYRRRK
jgi:hypothetical protein